MQVEQLLAKRDNLAANLKEFSPNVATMLGFMNEESILAMDRFFAHKGFSSTTYNEFTGFYGNPDWIAVVEKKVEFELNKRNGKSSRIAAQAAPVSDVPADGPKSETDAAVGSVDDVPADEPVDNVEDITAPIPTPTESDATPIDAPTNNESAADEAAKKAIERVATSRTRKPAATKDE